MFMEQLVMEINDFKSINKANIEINKINVVGGVNGSGKSTASKIFYSFLKGNSTKRTDYFIQSVGDEINDVIDLLNYGGNEYNLPEHIKIDDDFSVIKNAYYNIHEISEKHDKLAKLKSFELIKQFTDEFKNFSKTFENKDIDINKRITEHIKKKIDAMDTSDSDRDDFVNEGLHYIDFIFNKDFEDEFDMDDIRDKINIYENALSDDLSFDEFKEVSDNYYHYVNKIHTFEVFSQLVLYEFNDIIMEMLSANVFPDGFYLGHYYDFIEENSIVDLDMPYDIEKHIMDFNEINDLLKLIEYFHYHNNISEHYLFLEDPINLLESHTSDLSKYAFNYILKKESVYSPFNENNFYMKSTDSKSDAFEYFFNNGFTDSIYYVDNVSIFELRFQEIFFTKLFHMDEIIEDAFVKKITNGEQKLNKSVENILEKIQNIIKGRYHLDGIYFKTDKMDNPFPSAGRYSNNVTTSHVNTPSGIKQIGIIQLLLFNNKLQKDGYLIIDEPEVNLHPDWQFKFAEILVLLAKDLNITIYLNSHSPFFIEAIDAFTEFYDMKDDINYYLTEESENEGKYNFIKIDSNELYKIYENLGNAYDLINQLRLRKRLVK